MFGSIKTFTVEFEIPCAELNVQMEIRGEGKVILYSLSKRNDFIYYFVSGGSDADTVEPPLFQDKSVSD